MKENLTLEENQKKEFKQVIAQYTFSVEVDGVTSNERSILNVEKKGIALHFLRYGLFDIVSDYSAPTTSYTSPDSAEFYRSIFVDEQEKATIAKVRNEPANKSNQQQAIIEPSILLEEVIINHSIPDNENFNTARTPLRAGYVYMINDATPLDDFKEFRVDDYGMIYEIDWSKNKKDGKYLDQRKANGKSMMYKILDRDDQTYCFAYSPVQWSAAYVNELLTNQQKRDERCKTKVLCKGISKNEGSNDIEVTHYKQTHIVVEGNNPMAYKYNKILDRIASEEQKEDEEGGNTLLENMFITLDDPMGCADIMCVGIDTEINRLKALMISLQTGQSAEEVFPYLQKKEQVPIKDSEKSKQIQYLHRLAQLTYDFVYNNRENAEKYESDLIESTTANIALDLTVGGLLRPFIEQNGVKKSKLEKLLGVQERADQRCVINSYRDDLGNLMKSEYYQNATDDYINSIADSIEDAKGIMAEHLIALGQYPNMHDKHLDLKTVYQPKQDTWYKPINNTLYNENPELFIKSTKLLDYKIDFQDIITLSLAGKTVSNMRKILKAYANHSDFKGGYATLALHRKVSYFRNKNTKVATFKFRALENFDQYLLENKKQLRLELDGKGISLKKFKKYWHIEYEKMTAKAAQQFIDEGKVTLNMQNSPKRFEQEIKKFYQSGALASVLLVIEGVFWAEAVHKFNKDKNVSNFLVLSGASIKLGAAITRLAEETKTYEKLFAKETAKEFKKYGKVLGIASSAISVYSLGNSALTSFSYRDTDAALAYGVATGLSGVFLAVDVSALIASFGGASFLVLGFWPAALVGGLLWLHCILLINI